MNSLSLLVYIAGVTEGIQVMSALFLLGGLVVVGMTKLSRHMDDKEQVPLSRWLLSGFIGAAVLLVFLPSGKTVYLMAASELGEKAAQTEDAKEIYDLLRKRVKEALK